MLDAEHVHMDVAFLDLIDDTELAPACAVHLIHRCTKMFADSLRILGQRTSDELPAGNGDSLGKILREGSSCLP